MEILGILIVAFILISILKPLEIPEEKTLEAYKHKNPDSVRNGKVSCSKCGGSNIWMKQVSRSPRGVVHSHLCRQCGSELYRSVLTD